MRLRAFIGTSGDFFDRPRVADAVSALYRGRFGSAKTAVRSVIGVASLPLGMPVALEVIVEAAEWTRESAIATRSIVCSLPALVIVLTAVLELAAREKDAAGEQQVFHRAVKVDGLSIFCREAGSKDAPTIGETQVSHISHAKGLVQQPFLQRAIMAAWRRSRRPEGMS